VTKTESQRQSKMSAQPARESTEVQAPQKSELQQTFKSQQSVTDAEDVMSSVVDVNQNLMKDF